MENRLMPDPVCRAIGRFLRQEECLRCEVCCRFPEASSPLAPFFSNAEMGRAIAVGLDPESFPPGRYGPGHAATLRPEGPVFRCGAFRPASNDCGIYDNRPLDCRLYPFMLIYDRSGGEVLFGLDSYCPAARSRPRDPERLAAAAETADLLDGPLADVVVEARGIVSAWKEHVTALRRMPNLSRRLCRSDLGLARLTATVAGELDERFAAFAGPRSYHSFPAVYVWSDVFDLYWKLAGEQLLLFAAGDGDAFLVAPPLGRRDDLADSAGREAMEILDRLNPGGASPRIQECDSETAARLAGRGWRAEPGEDEYVYSRRDMADLAGNRFEKKRQLCNRFERENRWRWRAFASSDLPAAVALHRNWLRNRSAVDSDALFVAQAEASFRCVGRALREASALGLAARVLEGDGGMVGFTAGWPLHDGKTLHIFCEIADLAVRGAAQFMFREFCREFRDHAFVNAGGASGLGGLARVKESYRPCARLPGFNLTLPA